MLGLKEGRHKICFLPSNRYVRSINLLVNNRKSFKNCGQCQNQEMQKEREHDLNERIIALKGPVMFPLNFK